VSFRSSIAARGSLTSLPGSSASSSGEMRLAEGLSVLCNGEMGTTHVSSVLARRSQGSLACPLESPEIVLVKFPGPGKSWKMSLVLESPGILLGSDVDAKTFMSAHLCSICYVSVLQPLLIVHLAKRVQLCVVYTSLIRSVALKCSIGLMTGSWKMLLGSCKVLEFFVTKRLGIL